MVLKSTSIHANFFPQGEAYQTADADAEPSTSTTPEASQPTSASQTPRNSISRPKFLNRNTEKNQKNQSQLEMPAGHEHGNIILVDWDGPDDPENPMNWPNSKKWFITMLLNLMCFFIGLATAAYSTGLSPMVEELGVSIEVGRLGMFLFNFAFSIIPLVLSALSEQIGSTIVYLVSLSSFVIWFIPLGVATNIQTVLIARFFLGASGAAGTTIIPGTLAGVWATNERATPIALFSLVAVLGTVGAPLYSGFIVETIGWRWVEWIHMIASGIVLIAELAFLRETRGSVVLTRKAKKLRKETGDQRYRSQAELETPTLKHLLHVTTTRAAMLLVKEPVVLFFSLWLAYAWSLVFALFSGIPIVFTEQRGWSTGVGGLAYIGPVLACFFAFGLSFHGKQLYDRAQERNKGIAVPEARLYYAAVGAILAPVGMFIFAFTSYSHVHWIAPIIGLTILVMGIYFIFDGVQAYLSDSYGEYASSAISAQGFVRNSMAASFPLFSTQMFHNLTVPFAGLMLALLLTIAIPLPFILIKYGERIRASSKFAATNTGLKDDEDGMQGPVIGSRRKTLKDKNEVREKNEVLEPWSPTASGNQTRVPSLNEEKKEEEVVQKQVENLA